MSNNNNNVTVSQLEQYKLEKKLKFEREKAAEEDLRKENEIAAIAVENMQRGKQNILPPLQGSNSVFQTVPVKLNIFQQSLHYPSCILLSGMA